ncbi:MAG: hypothetical protein A2068_01950 [Ignavibacteria bacterium GWB2_35_6b]|nr:MAG: hypothetical protein A2068_01950 [Ignavibacteria bacterium GWB2_35_6b]
MAETSKYDFFTDELNALEKQIYVFLQKNEELQHENKELLSRLRNIDKENEVLKLKLEEIEIKLNHFEESESPKYGDTLHSEEKEDLKNKISDLISKIDYHLRS